MPSEAYLVQKIIKAVRKEYPSAYVRKLADRFNRALPDVLIVVNCVTDDHEEYEFSEPLFVEVKRPNKGRIAPIQEAERACILDAGGWHLFATSVDEVMRELEEMGAVP